MAIGRLAIDTGHATQKVYAWMRRQSPACVLAVKGVERLSASVGVAGRMDVTGGGKRQRRGLLVWPVGSSFGKSELYGYLRKDRTTLESGEPHPPGYCHFPQYDEEFFRQHTAERQIGRAPGRER